MSTTKKANLKRKLLLTDLSDDETDVVPNTNDELLLLQDLQKSKKQKETDSTEEPSSKNTKKKKCMKTTVVPPPPLSRPEISKTFLQPPPPPTVAASVGGTKSIPNPVTNLTQVPEDDVPEVNYNPAPVTARTKTKHTSESNSKSARVKKPKKTTTGSLDISTHGYKPGILASPPQTTDYITLLPNADVVEDETLGNVAEENPPTRVTGFGSHDSANYIQSKEVIPVNVTALAVTDNSPVILADESNDIINGLPHIEVTVVGNGNATESPTREIQVPDNLLDMTMSEVANLFDSSPANDLEHQEVEHPFAQVNVNGYSVRQSLAATAQIIFSQYGDIVADSSHTLSFRSCMLDSVCLAYQKLEKSTLSKLTLHELEAIRKDIGAVAKLNFNVSWFIKRLDEIHDAKESLEQFSCLKNERVVSDVIVSQLTKELEMQKAIMRKTQEKVEDIEEKINSEKEKVEARDLVIVEGKRRLQKFHKKISLVDGM